MKVHIPKIKRLGQNPSFDWYFCLSCFVVVLVFIALIDAYIYMHVTEAPTTAASVGDAADTLSIKDVQDIAQKIRDRRAMPKNIPAIVLREPSL